jgi:hypothetical protein
MGLPVEVNPLLASSLGYNIGRSLRLRNSASAYLNRTFSSNGSQQTWTWSGWVKAGRFGSQQPLFCAYSSPTNYALFTFSANAFISATDTLKFYTAVSNVGQAQLETAAVFRDPSAWYHIILQVDTTQATASNRVRIYVNGVQQTLTGTQPSQNTNLGFYNTTSVPHQIGALASGTYGYYDGYLAEINFIDGQALTPSSFGQYDDYGIWQPKKYSGTYGTNGFYLPFSNTTSTTTLVADASGNGNNWTPNNISLTAGTTYDSMIDVPTNSGAASNYCVWNRLATTQTVTGGNLDVSIAAQPIVPGTMGVTSGKWYWEIIPGSTTSGGWQVGVVTNQANLSLIIGADAYGWAYVDDARKRTNGTPSAYGASFTTNDVIGVALDMDAGTITFYKNNVSQGQAFSGITGTVFPAISTQSASLTSTASANFGQRPFTYTPPSGFKALNTFNLPDPSIKNPAPYMNAITYTSRGLLIPPGFGMPTKRNALNQNVSKSIRFRASNSAHLNRSPSSSTNRSTFTWSGWVKTAIFNQTNVLMIGITGTSNGSQRTGIYFSGDAVTVADQNMQVSSNWSISTAAVFKDPSAWYHVVAAVDTTQATAANRIKIYVNGTLQTLTGSYPSQNYSTAINYNFTHYIARWFDSQAGSNYHDCYMTEVNFIDGQQLTAASFGELNSDNVWVPKTYTGTYGTNGFYLPFTNTTSTTTLGNDSSGNGNNWTTNGISLTAGVTYDSMTDSPTDYASAGNYAAWNPYSDLVSGCTLSNGNLRVLTPSSGDRSVPASIYVSSGKWYAEFLVEDVGAAGSAVGLVDPTMPTATSPGLSSLSYGYLSSGGKRFNSTDAAYGNSFTTNDVISCALDLDNGKVWWGKNGVWQASGDPGAGTNAAFTGVTGPLTFAWGDRSSAATTQCSANFGQQAFTYTIPTGFKALNTFNLSSPPTNTWWSSLNNRGRSNATSLPDLVWIKSRSSAQNHALVDTVRGATLTLLSNSGTSQSGLGTVLSNNKFGLTLGNDASVNTSGATNVLWGWQAGLGTNTTNTSGTITSTVSANPSTGFSIVAFTGNGTSSQSVGHGLGIAPKLIFVKDTTNYNWYAYTTATGTNLRFEGLNTTAAAISVGSEYTTTSTLVNNIPSTASLNSSGALMLLYCWAPVDGYSAIGSYTGNASADGPFIYTGFRPRFVMVKKSSAVGNWLIFDTSRSAFNVQSDALFPNLSNAETTTSNYNNDFVSNGFKIRTLDGSWNDSGVTYIYMAFAENPFKYARAR